MFRCFLRLLVPLQFKFNHVGVDHLLGWEINHSFILLWALVYEITIVGWEVYDLDIGRDIFQNLILNKELFILFAQIIDFDLRIL